ncbi:hypothetical protein AB0O28_29165 [Microbispora sp. NPDC088329]|uniref:hypothetical protein n=1 Tax=Microbispora sp. NPDC088329 TaxID=3154869 RepID=UPI00342DD52C
MSRRHLAGLLAVAVCTQMLASCTRRESPTSPEAGEAERRGQALVAVVQCFVDHNVLARSEAENHSWFENGKVQQTAALVDWASSHAETSFSGKTLQVWEDEATAGWPGWRCPL